LTPFFLKDMKKPILFSMLMVALSATAQQDVTLKIRYNDLLLCNWEVTLKHGDVALAKATSDAKGICQFSGVRIISKSVDASGYKAHPGGDKKWDAKGYITLNEDYYGELDFGPIVKEAGMPVSMLEGAWGLTLNDCGGVVANPQTTPGSAETAPTGTPQSAPADPTEDLKRQRAALQKQIANIHSDLDESKGKTETEKPGSAALGLAHAEVREHEANLALKEHRLAVVEKQLNGQAPETDDQITEKQLMDKHAKAKQARKENEKEAREEFKAEHNNMTPLQLKMKIKTLETKVKLKERALRSEEESATPDSERIERLRDEVQQLNGEIAALKAM